MCASKFPLIANTFTTEATVSSSAHFVTGLCRQCDMDTNGVRSATSPMKVIDCPMTEHEAAEKLRLSVKTLRAWRHRGTGPRFVRFGRAVRYLSADMEAFIRASTVETSSSR